jgi:hypothetical protein
MLVRWEERKEKRVFRAKYDSETGNWVPAASHEATALVPALIRQEGVEGESGRRKVTYLGYILADADSRQRGRFWSRLEERLKDLGISDQDRETVRREIAKRVPRA